MRIPSLSLAFAAVLAAAVSCSHTPAPEATAPQAGQPPAAGAAAPGAPASLAGDWTLTLLVQGNSTDGAIRLRQRSDGSYVGFMQMEGASQGYAVRQVRMEGAHFVVVVDTDDGEATIEGNLRGQTRFDALWTARHASGRLMGTKQ